MGLLFVGCAVAMTLAALAFVLLPLTRRRVHDARAERMRALDAALAAGVIDADEHARKRAALAANPAPANTARGAPLALVVALAVFIPASAALLYRAVGTPQALDPKARAPVAASGDHTSAADMQQAIAALAERLKQEPGDVEGWALLGRAHATLGQAGAAVEAYRHAHELAPDDAAVGVEYAQALALAAPDHRIAGKARELLDAIAAREPTNQRALWLLGISDYQVGRYDAAIARWNALLPLLADNPGVADSVRAQIAEAQARRDGTGRVDPDATLFVFARAASGPAMPLAIARLRAAQLPATVKLDDSMGMLPTLKLSDVPEVIVGARISRSGNASAQSGDLQVASAPLDVHRRDPIRLTIDSVVP